VVDEDLLEVGQPVAVGVRIVGIGSDQQFKPVRQTIAVAIEEGVDRRRSDGGRCRRRPILWSLTGWSPYGRRLGSGEGVVDGEVRFCLQDSGGTSRCIQNGESDAFRFRKPPVYWRIQDRERDTFCFRKPPVYWRVQGRERNTFCFRKSPCTGAFKSEKATLSVSVATGMVGKLRGSKGSVPNTASITS